jgi:hypothetical protein
MEPDKYQMILVFDTKEMVTQQTIIPENEEAGNFFIKWFNKDYVIVSDTEWKAYTMGKILKIQLSFILDNALFSITSIPTPK